MPLWLASAAFIGYCLRAAVDAPAVFVSAAIVTVLLITAMRYLLVDRLEPTT